LFLENDRKLGGEVALRPRRVQEAHAAVVDGGGAGAVEADGLVATTVGEDVALPAGEGVEAARAGDGLAAGGHPEVVGVGQDHTRTEAAEVLGVDGLDRAAGANGHEGRRLDHAMAQG
jgi:hypothetical protein